MSRWRRVHLGDVVRTVERVVSPVPGISYRQIGVKLWGEGAYEREPIDGGATKYAKLFRAEAGDIIVNKIWARNGSVAIVPESLAGCHGSSEFPMFEPDRAHLDSRWIHWLTKTHSFWAACDEQSRGTSGKNRIRLERFLEIEIPLPPLAEQRRVVARIEEMAACAREASGLSRRGLQEAGTLWARGASTILDRLEGAPLLPLGAVTEIRGGGTPSKSNPFYWAGKIPWISPKDMKAREIQDARDHISELATRETAAKLIEPGAVLVVVRGMILAHTVPVAVLRVAAAINQDLKALLPRKGLLPEFLCAFFWAYNSRFVDLIEKSTHDTRKLETPKLLDTKIPVPDVPGQRRIVTELNALQSEVEELKRLQAETAVELDALLPSLLDRAFRAEL